MNNKRIIGLTILFVVTFLVSILINLPLNWLVSKPQIKQMLESKINASQHLKINSSRGTIWQGELDVSLVTNPHFNQISANTSKPNPKNMPLGIIQFHLNLLPLLWANLSADIDWQLNNASSSSELSSNSLSDKTLLRGHLSTSLLSSAQNQTLVWQTSKGQLQLDSLASKLIALEPDQAAVFQNIAGLVSIKQLTFEYKPQLNWFSAFDANLEFKDIKAMNNVFPPISLTSHLKDSQILSRLDGQTKDWTLTGEASLTKQLRYQVDLSVNAKDAKDLPDWAYLMNKKSKSNYNAKFVGRF